MAPHKSTSKSTQGLTVARKTKVIQTGYNPRKIQAWLHQNFKRFNVVVAHRRLGKTVCCVNEMLDRALKNGKKNPQYAYIAPYYSQAKRIVWDYLKEFTKNIPGVKVHEGELKVEIKRRTDTIRFYVLGADNPDSIRGIYLDGVILDEFGQFVRTVWTQVVRPTLSDRKGWAIFIGTPRGQNHFYHMYKFAKQTNDWFTALLKASETGIIDEEELQDLKETMDPDDFEQEYECSFNAANKGSYYGPILEKMKDKVVKVPHDPALEVFTAWDLGIDDMTAIWFYQNNRGTPQIIEYLEESGQGLPHYVALLKARSYVYGTHFLPHDAQARELGTGKTRVETLRSLGLRDIVVVSRQSVEDGINAVRNLLPKCYFDEKNCDRGLDALRNYQRKFDEKAQTFLQKPLHDWSSHGADAFRTLALSFRERRVDQKDLPVYAEHEFDVF